MSQGPRELYVAEPPAHYMVRPPIVIDCSALAGLLFHEPWQELAEKSLAGRELHAPYLLQAEIASVAVKKVRQGLAPGMVDDGLAQCEEMEIDLHRIDVPETVTLAARYHLSAYDAAYLWLAVELKAPLATFDQKLATAARAHWSTLP